jgi:hypothetical protein
MKLHESVPSSPVMALRRMAAVLLLSLPAGTVLASECERQSIELSTGDRGATLLLPPCANVTVNARRLDQSEGRMHARGNVAIRVVADGGQQLTILADSATLRSHPADPGLDAELKLLEKMAADLQRSGVPVGALPDPASRSALVPPAATEPALAGLLEKYRWPGFREVGEEGAEAFMLAMRSARPDFLRQYIDRARASVRDGNAWAGDLAALEDRLLSAQGKPQRYGTAIFRSKDGIYRPFPIENPTQVDVLRQEVGLDSLQEYLSSVNR